MYDSPGYRAARALRAGATACFNMVLVEGVDAPGLTELRNDNNLGTS